MIYAYFGGIKIPNILMVFLFYFVTYLVYKPAFTEIVEATCPEEVSAMNIYYIVTNIWIVVVLLFSAIEMKLDGDSTGGEESYLLPNWKKNAMLFIGYEKKESVWKEEALILHVLK